MSGGLCSRRAFGAVARTREAAASQGVVTAGVAFEHGSDG
jgi:hypothetical protein